MKVKIHRVAPALGEQDHFGSEPSWEKGYVPTNYQAEIGKALSWHARCATSDDAYKYVEEWISIFRPQTAKEDLARWRKVKKSELVTTYPAIARIRIRGFPVSQHDLNRMWAAIESLMEHAEGEKPSIEREATKISVKDRIAAQLTPKKGDIDGFVDSLVSGEQPDNKEFLNSLCEGDFKAPHYRQLAEYISSLQSEFQEVQELRKESNLDDNQKQLIEAYSYIGTRQLNRLVKSLEEVRVGLLEQAAKNQARKVRKPRPVDRAKVVSKLRFMKSYPDLGLECVDPVKLLGASEAWVYDTAKRKLHHIVGEVSEALHVRGVKIHGLGEESSAKTLRKPEEQLKEFLTLGKAARVAWFNKLTTKASNTTGRTTEDMILLKVN